MKRGTLLFAFIATLFMQVASAQTTLDGISYSSAMTPMPTIGNQLLVYPNPVALDTRIVLNEPSPDVVQAAVLGMAGRIEATYKYAPGTRVLYMDMSTLPVGLYNVQVSGAGIATTYLRVVKQ